MILTKNQTREYLAMAGFTGQPLDYAVQICQCESDNDTNARALTNREDSRGLMQINIFAHPEYQNLNLYDPLINCQVAYQLYLNRRKTFSDWTCAKNLGLEFPDQNPDQNPDDKKKVLN